MIDKIVKASTALLILSLNCLVSKAQSNDLQTWLAGNTTPTVEQCFTFYKQLAEEHSQVSWLEYGATDCGIKLPLVVFDRDGRTDAAQIKRNNAVMLINNGIHPGEPCGINASMLFADWLLNQGGLDEFGEHVTVCIIPIYNIGGALNRNCCSRANQDGPQEYGFRGNARNLDLNRDFVKQDSKNAREFARIFQEWQPEVLIDTHTSNGADYQYTMTLLSTQPDKLPRAQAHFLTNTFEPKLYEGMKNAGWEMCPYVNNFRSTPDNGIAAFYDSPRYSSGYAALFGTLGFTTEAHMLKPFPDRVRATESILKVCLELTNDKYLDLKKIKESVPALSMSKPKWDLHWEIDSSDIRKIEFKGYEAGYRPSEVTGRDRLYYDESNPWTKEIDYYHKMKPVVSAIKPNYYIIPRAWQDVAEKLRLNGVEVMELKSDFETQVEHYYIEDYDTGTRPFEGHYLHYDVQLRTEQQQAKLREGDFVVAMNQDRARFILEVLEPQAPDSYFAWNFFDAILQQKEWFSPYVFEDEAAELLARDADLKAELEERLKDPAFANDPWAPLYFVYRHSNRYEASHNRYPIARIMSKVKLPVH